MITTYLYRIYVTEQVDSAMGTPATTKFEKVMGENIAFSEVDNRTDTTVVFIGGLSAWNGTWQRTINWLRHGARASSKMFSRMALYGYYRAR